MEIDPYNNICLFMLVKIYTNLIEFQIGWVF